MIEVRMRFIAIAFLAALWSGPAAGADDWVRLSTPDFELYTNAGEKKGREAMEHFEQVRGFFAKASPVRAAAAFPVRIIVFKTKPQFDIYNPNPVSSAYFAGGPERDYIVMHDPSPESYPVAVHEYVHLLIRHSGLRIPLWLNEGWADVYSTMRPAGGGVAVGDLIPGRMQPLETGRWMDLDRLNAINERSPDYHEADRAGLFYAESWALTHMLFLSPEYRGGFGKFVTALHRGSSLEEACRSAFGRTTDQVMADLKKYLSRRKIYGAVFETGLGKPESQIQTVKLPEFDARLMLADLLAITRHVPEARHEYEQLEQLRPNEPEVMQSLGFLAYQSHDPESARKYFEKAFAGGDTDARMCFLLGVLEKDAKQPVEKVVAPLECAVASKPDYTSALLQLGVIETQNRNFEAAIGHLMSIANVTPEFANPLFTSLAYAYLETGDVERARRNVLSARNWARTPMETQEAERLSELIEARAQGPYAARPGEKVQRVEGNLEAVDCSPGAMRLKVRAGERSLTFALPEPKAVEYGHAGGPEPRLSCGTQQGMRITVDYVPASAVEQSSSGIVRRIEF